MLHNWRDEVGMHKFNQSKISINSYQTNLLFEFNFDEWHVIKNHGIKKTKQKKTNK